MIVRPERADDHDAIATVVGAAFASADEVQLVVDLRQSDGYVPDLALVADDDGEIVGHVMFTITIVEDGTPVLMLSPLAVRPDRQRTGVGTALVENGLARCRLRDEGVVIVEGDPRYYARFGFVAASTVGLEPPHETIPAAAFQALPLRPDHPRGRVAYPWPYEVK